MGEYGSAWVRGVQQLNNPAGNGYVKVAASPKHFTGYSIETGDPGVWNDGTNTMHYGRSNFSGDVSRFDFEDTYLPPWRAAITTGGALGIMCSYDAPAGIPSCANKGLMVDVLQTEYGLAGPIVTDCGAIPGFICSHNYSATPVDAVAAALNAGVSIDCGPFGGDCDNGHGLQHSGNASYGWPSTMNAALKVGLFTSNDVDDRFKSVRNLFLIFFSIETQTPLSLSLSCLTLWLTLCLTLAAFYILLSVLC